MYAKVSYQSSLSNICQHVCYQRAEQLKKRKYDQRIRDIKHGTFSPLIFATMGGVGPIASNF